MNKLKTSIIAIGLSTSVASNAALVFEFDYGPNYNKEFIASSSQTKDGVSYKLRATTPTAGRSMAQQPGSQGLGVGAPGGANPWWVGDGEAINFELRVLNANGAMTADTADFSLVSFDATSNKIAYDERAYLTVNGNDYELGGNNTNVAGSKTIDADNSMGSNPSFPNSRGSQFAGWTSEVADNFTLTGGSMPDSAIAPGVTATNYRIELVRLELAPEAAPIPVPAAAWLFGSALAGLTLARRK
jgi:hypothetical protein